jgi:hypothetical protein
VLKKKKKKKKKKVEEVRILWAYNIESKKATIDCVCPLCRVINSTESNDVMCHNIKVNLEMSRKREENKRIYPMLKAKAMMKWIANNAPVTIE